MANKQQQQENHAHTISPVYITSLDDALSFCEPTFATCCSPKISQKSREWRDDAIILALMMAPPGLEDPCAFPEQAFAKYHPGELLKQSVDAPCMVMPPEQDTVSECSTADTQCLYAPCLAESMELNQTEPCETELPSIGSAGHKHGSCKPCGFFHHRGGCMQGADCSFCHLCPAGTIERQRRMKRKLVSAVRNC